MKKRNLALIVTAALVCGLTACSGSGGSGAGGSDSTQPSQAGTEAGSTAETQAEAQANSEAPVGDSSKKLVVGWWGNQVRNDRTQEVLDMYAQKNPGVTFDSQPSQFSDYWTKLATAAAGNSLPDVVQMNYSSYLEQYVKSGLLEDLTPYVEQGLLDVSEIDQGILDSGSVDGKLYAVCSGVNVPALIYNKTLTDELGIEIKNNMTIDEFMDISRQIYEKSGVKTDLAYGNAESMMDYILRGEGINQLYKEKGFNVSGEDAFQPFFDIYETGYNEGWMLDAGIYAELTVNSVEQCPLVYYSSPSTQSWCACYWSNQLTAMNQAAPEGVELEYATWPSKDPDKSNFLHPSMFFSVAAGSSQKEEAVKVLNYLTNDIDCNNVLLAERGVPAPANVAAAIAPKLSAESQKEVAFINDVVTPHSSTISACPPTASTEALSLANDLVEKVLYGQMTSAEASAQLYKQGNEILAK